MPDREKVIKALKEAEAYFRSSFDAMDGTLVCEMFRRWSEAIEQAVAFLKAQEPRVMTAEDMWTLKFNDTVIIEQKIPSLLIPAVVRDNIKHDHCLEVLQVVTASMDGGANADYDYYGKTWRCWNNEPTNEQMEATPWNVQS